MGIFSTDPFVWPGHDGRVRGQAIEPLYPSVPGAAKKDPRLYELLALLDVLRVGQAHEQQSATHEIKKRITA